VSRELPPPANSRESIDLRRSAAMFLDRAAQFAHRRFHVAFAQKMCDAAPPLISEADWMEGEATLPMLFERWCGSCIGWFDNNHAVPAVLRDMRLLDELFAEPWRVATLARLNGCSRTTLSEQFDQFVGFPPSEYLARVRTRKLMIRLRTSSDSNDDVARASGYQSNKFYRRVRELTGLTPSQIRALDEREFQRLLEECIPLRGLPRPSRRQTMN
jgi:AraC-like DNA-binding protein